MQDVINFAVFSEGFPELILAWSFIVLTTSYKRHGLMPTFDLISNDGGIFKSFKMRLEILNSTKLNLARSSESK